MGASVRYENGGKTAYFRGHKFTRDDRTGYYLGSTMIDGERKRLHRYVYETCHGLIPDGFEVHHRDTDKSNNEPENLHILIGQQHRALHGELIKDDPEAMERIRKNLSEKAQPKACIWHGSEVGRQWHREHYDKMKDQMYRRVEKVCDYCGEKYMGTLKNNDRFCSNKCKSAWRRKSGLDNETRQCAVCGQAFAINKYSKGKTCSRECTKKARIQTMQDKKHQADREGGCLQYGS